MPPVWRVQELLYCRACGHTQAADLAGAGHRRPRVPCPFHCGMDGMVRRTWRGGVLTPVRWAGVSEGVGV